MQRRIMFPVFVMSIICMSAINGLAIQKTVTVQYLNAALGTIEMRDRVSVTAIYVGSEGMEEAVKGTLRNKGLSRFYIKDQVSGAVFGFMYCDIKSSVFKTLIDINSDEKAFVFECVKSQGEDRRGALIVKSIRTARNVSPQSVAVSGPTARDSAPDKYRIIMINQATSNRTVTADVALGEKYDIMGHTIIIENMNPSSSDVRVMQ